MLAQLEKRVAFAFVQLLEIKDIFIERDRLFDVADFDRDVITTVNLNHREVEEFRS